MSQENKDLEQEMVENKEKRTANNLQSGTKTTGLDEDS